LAIEKKIYLLQQFKQNLTDAYKRELPALTVDSMEHPVLAGRSADIDLNRTVFGIFDISFQNKIPVKAISVRYFLHSSL